MNQQEKSVVVSELNSRFAAAGAAFLVNYEGCKCSEINVLRRDLRSAGSRFGVVKNTLAKRAIKETGASVLDEFFEGPVAVIWAGDDPVAPAKILSKFCEKQEKFKIRAAVVDGSVVNASGVEQLATLPSREEVLSQLLALINAPATQLLRTINAPAETLVRLLGAWEKEIEKRA